MRLTLASLVALASVVLFAPALSAQGPTGLNLPDVAAPGTTGVTLPSPVPDTLLRPPASRWSVDVLIGLPTGVRVQCAFADDGEKAWLVEGLIGVELVYPMVGGGIRRRLVSWSNDCDAFCFSPGVDFYFLFNPDHDGHGGFFSGGPENIGILAIDCDFQWKHDWSDRLAAELGAKVGLGLGYGGEDRWGILPVLGVYLGCRF